MKANHDNVTSEYLSKAASSSYCSVSIRSLDEAKGKGLLPFYRFGARKVLFRKADLDRWLSTMRVDALHNAREMQP